MPVALKSLSRKPKPPKPPEADPRFVKVMGDLRQKSLKVRQHPAPSKKASEAQAAAKGPANEKRAGAQEKQTDKIKDAKTKKPDENSFLALLRAEIQKAMPKTLADTETFMKGGDAPALTSSLKGNVSKQKQDATGDTAKTTKQAPDESSVQAKPVTPIPGEPQPPSPDVPAGDAMPQPKPDSEVSVQDSKQDTDAAMKDAEVTDDQCKKANDPRFSSVLTAKGDVTKQADAAPAKYRAGEKAALNASVAQSKAAAKVGAALMLQGKAKSKAGVSSKQEDAKKKDEQERQQVTDRIEAIFNKTKQQVEAKLTALDEEVNSIFDTGTEAALSAMKAYVEKRIDDYKDDRYSGVIGKGRWLKDKFMGLPDEANVFYVQGRDLFTQLMDTLVVRVANLVETRLREAKSLVAAGQAEIKSYVASLSPKLKGVGLEAQKKVSDQFAELERTIDDKKNQLAQSLAQKYKEAFDKADKALKEIQDANKGLVSAFLDKLGEIIKIIMEFKDKLMGVLRKGWDVIKGILADPIGFLGNLIAAIKQGVGQFVSNIWTHLKAGFMKWLFGALADAGIEIPPGLPSLPSILKLVLSVLGLTYERMRAKAVKLLGPTAVTIIEKAIEYVRALITGGPAALWEKVKEDLSSLKDMVIGAIQDWIITTIIKQATVKLLSMFNPAGAFVQACIMIYNTVMFLIERAAQIMAFVEAVINSVSAIASGAIGGAAAWIERSLANAIPIVIGFLAALIGLGGISKKIKETIEKVQGIVDRAIDKAIGKVIEVVKKLFGKLTGKDDPEKQKKVQAGLAELDAEDRKRFHDGKISRKDAEQVAGIVKAGHPVFKSIKVKDGGSNWVYSYEASPAEEHVAGPKEPDPKGAAAKLEAAADAAKTVASASENGRKAFESGEARESAKREKIKQRPGGTALPTKKKGEESGPGLDVGFLTTQTREGETEDVVELIEVKKGKSPRVIKRRSSSRPIPERFRGDPSKIIPVPSGEGEAVRMVGEDPEVARRVATGEAAMVQDNRLVQNQLSGITENLRKNIDKMYEQIAAAMKEGTLPPDTLGRVQNVVEGRGGVLRFVVDIEKAASLSDAEVRAARALVTAAFKNLQQQANSDETKLRVIIKQTK
jgi:hypothetical protein